MRRKATGIYLTETPETAAELEALLADNARVDGEFSDRLAAAVARLPRVPKRGDAAARAALADRYGLERVEEALDDAAQARATYEDLRGARAHGDIEDAARLGFELGSLIERVRVREHEADAARGANVLAGARDGGESRRGERKANRGEVDAAWRELVAANPRMTKARADARIAKRFGVCTKTVARYRLDGRK